MLHFDSATCRVCLAICVDIVPIFESTGSGALRLREKLEFVTRTELSRHSGLPRGLCGACRAALDAAYALATRCIAAETMFAKAIKSEDYVKVELESCTPEARAGLALTGSKESDAAAALHSAPAVSVEPTLKYELSDGDPHFQDDAEDVSPPERTLKVKKVKHRKKRKKRLRSGEKASDGGGSGWVCGVCGLVARAPSALHIHMRKHTGERPYACAHCGRTFSQKGTLVKHTASRHSAPRAPPPPAFTCEVCGKRFVRKRDVTVHLRVHTGESPYACSYCPSTFKQVGPLIRHRRIHTGEKPFLCSECPKRFKDKSSLAAHASSHSDERRFACSLCDKRMKTSNSLRKHMDRHAHGRKHVCDRCGRAFALKGNLKMHMQRQHSERSGVCGVCRKPVPDADEHARRHTGQLLPCAQCGRRFLRAAGLRAHLARHARAAAHPCVAPACRAAFPTLAMLHHHAAKHHRPAPYTPPYPCAHCVRAFLRSCDLTKHLKIAHNILKAERIDRS